jgi:hypothetical protein
MIEHIARSPIALDAMLVASCIVIAAFVCGLALVCWWFWKLVRDDRELRQKPRDPVPAVTDISWPRGRRASAVEWNRRDRFE